MVISEVRVWALFSLILAGGLYGQEEANLNYKNILRVVATEVKGSSLKSLADVDSVAHKVFNALKKLPKQEYDVSMNAIKLLKKITRFSTEELVKMAQSRNLFDAAVKQYYPQINTLHAQELGQEGIIKELQQVAKIDLYNSTYNDLRDYMCHMMFLSSFAENMSRADVSDNHDAQRLQRWFNGQVCQKVSLLFVLVNDAYFFPGWQQELAEVAQTFRLLHAVTAQIEGLAC